MLDTQKNGKLSLKEIRDSMSTVKRGGEDFFNSLINIARINSDKAINEKEFYFILRTINAENEKSKTGDIEFDELDAF